MAYGTFDRQSHPTALGAIRAGFAGFREAISTYRRKRRIYLTTLRELQSYRSYELDDIRMQPADFEAAARRQAGW